MGRFYNRKVRIIVAGWRINYIEYFVAEPASPISTPRASSLKVVENVLLPLEFLEYDDKTAIEKARKILKLVELDDKSHHLPTQLSGGQQQRVSIARSLAADPEIILADEPTGNLDSKTGKIIMDMFNTLWKEEGKTIIMVTHDLKLAKYAHTTIELKDGQIIKISKKLR